MIPDPSSPSSGGTSAGASSFVQAVSVKEKPPRHRQAERLIVAGWLLIAVKSAVVWWACIHYAVPFHPMWIIAPTVAFAALCTGVYLWGRR